MWPVDWALTVWTRCHGTPPDGPAFALVAKSSHGLVLASIDNRAKALGLRTGQRHTDARAIEPGLVTASADPDSDREALLRLAEWCRRWTPDVVLDWSGGEFSGLMLEVGGSAHLFGGEAKLLEDMSRRLARSGVAARLALADTPGAAWALARFSRRGRTIAAPGGTRQRVAGLRLEALRIDAATLAVASSLGFKRIGDLFDMPRAGLARRFHGVDGLGLVQRLDQMLGLRPETLDVLAVAPDYMARAVFAEPLIDAAGVEAALPRLIDDLAAQLATHHLGARELTLMAFRTDGGVVRLGIRLGTASRQPLFWQRLFAQKGIANLDLGFGVDALILCADQVESLAAVQPDMDSEDQPREPLNELVDRLAARLGDRAVSRPQPRGSWLPERAEQWLPAQTGSRSAPARLGRERPLLLLDPAEPVEASVVVIPEGAPQQFRWRRVLRRVTRAEGPERLSAEWWRNAAKPRRTRDYYRVEDDTGARYWMFREGLYGWEDGVAFDSRSPTWWLHGLFA